MISILYSNKTFGGAEIYVRKLKDEFKINFWAIKDCTILKLIFLCFSNESIIFHDIRASFFKIIRPFKADKVVIHGPGKHPKFIKFVVKLLSITNCEIIMVSQDLFKQFNGFSKVVLLKNSSSFDSVNLKFENFDFIYFGRLEASKGSQILIDFWNKNNINKKLHIVGDGELFNNLKENVNSNIIFYGSLSQLKIKQIIEKNCAYYISLSFREGLSLSLLEGLSCGLVPIVANIPSQQFISRCYGYELVKEDLSNLLGIVDNKMTKEEIIKKCKKTKSTFNKLNINNEFAEYWKKTYE